MSQELSLALYAGMSLSEKPPPELEAILARLHEEARRDWPPMPVPASDFFRFLGERLGDLKQLATELKAMRLSELYLAFACGQRIPLATQILEQRYFGEVRQTLSSFRSLDVSARDDILQSLRQRLLVGDSNGQPRIFDYLGRGPLGGWLCTAGIRLALDVLRRGGREVVTDEVQPLMDVASVDPELDAIRLQFQKEFQAAFSAAVKSLDQRTRTVLRMNVIDGLNIEQIGRVYHVHRSTIARWIAIAREQILQQTRQQLARQLLATPSELNSLMRLVDSHLEVSLQSLLVSGDRSSPG